MLRDVVGWRMEGRKRRKLGRGIILEKMLWKVFFFEYFRLFCNASYVVKMF